MLKCLKHLGIEFTVAFLSGICGFVVLFYLCILTGIEGFFDFAGCKTTFFIGVLIGFPIGASLGVLITKKYFSKTSSHYIACFVTSSLFTLLFAFLTVRFLFSLLTNLFAIGDSLEILFLFLVPVYALVGYYATECLWKK